LRRKEGDWRLTEKICRRKTEYTTNALRGISLMGFNNGKVLQKNFGGGFEST